MYICLAPKERRWERGVYAASTHDCQQATDCSNALLLAMLKRRERRAPINTYREIPGLVNSSANRPVVYRRTR